MKTSTTFAAGLLAATLAAAPAAAQDYEMTLAHVLSDQSAYQVILTRFEELVEERTDGRIAVEVQCCGQAGNETRAIQAIRTGVLTGGFVGGSSLENVVPAYRVLSLPYVFSGSDEAYEILGGETGREMLDLLGEYGMYGLGWGAIFERSVGSRTPVASVEDMQGLKIRVLPTPGFVEAYKAMGTQPTPMAYGELFMALQNGVVDALEISPDAIVADKFVEVVDHYTLTKAHQSTTVFVLSDAFWSGLPDDLKTIVQEAALDAIAHGVEAHRELNRAGLEQVRAMGITVTEPDLAPFAEAARPSWDVILADAPEAQALLETIQAARQ
ncbi:TRAP transporter substrate-binding protein [Salinarimonas ramus]|uniref:C4-dicarboxylate ABC transporter substrate-binding protein n=1 Tax=Salinarimonas ramus TaxID=690164 RepID=A0A917V8A5_9HYPH|nr:TRAP transporter substrate-binding protein [Salinarimonas ramus]GGK50869.1 C4-dicarboxylate ABC transporter substrate-binding protein [Salinarimonas ramus]